MGQGREGHHKHCPYVQCAEEWINLADIDGEWEVIDVLDVRGPPEQRFWKLWWKPYPGQEKVEAERSEQDDGSWRHGWQPARNCTRLVAMQRTFINNNRQMDPRASLEGLVWCAEKGVVIPQPRCPHCNYMAGTPSAQKKHAAECIYTPVKRSKDSPAGKIAMRKRLEKEIKQYPAPRVHAPAHPEAERGYVTLKKVSSMVALGHLATSDASTEADMYARMGKATGDFVKGMHLWTHPHVRRNEKLRMFRRHMMQLLYGASVTWYLTGALCRRLNWWTARKIAIICGTDAKTEAGKRKVQAKRQWAKRTGVLREQERLLRKQQGELEKEKDKVREQRREAEHLRMDAERLRKQRNTAKRERDDAKTQLQQLQREAGVARAARKQVIETMAEATTAMAEAMAAAEKRMTAVRGAGHHRGHVRGSKGSM
eukprot:COSAG05_NODE_489_length_9314_cov_115.648655_4_plen_427_part_00